MNHPTQKLVQLCDLLRGFKNEQANRRHEETDSFRATRFSTDSGSRSDIATGPAHQSFPPLVTLAPLDRLTY